VIAKIAPYWRPTGKSLLTTGTINSGGLRQVNANSLNAVPLCANFSHIKLLYMKTWTLILIGLILLTGCSIDNQKKVKICKEVF